MKQNYESLMRSVRDTKLGSLVSGQFARFLLVGFSAFIVNALLLYFFKGVLGLPLLVAQLLGAEGTIMYSFFLHHNWTYRSYVKKSLMIRFLEFNLTALGGSIISTVSVLVASGVFGIHYLLGLSIGAVLATSWNYFSNLYFIWNKKKTTKEPVDQSKHEVQLFTQYLISKNPTELNVKLYKNTIANSKYEVTEKDERILNYALKHPGLIGIIDAGCAATRPHTELRRRIYICFAILESTPEFAKYFLPTERSRLYFGRVILSGVSSAAKGFVGVILVLFL